MKYDSKQDTQSHIARVTDLLEYVTMIIERRAAKHDASKLGKPEKHIFDEVTPALRGMTYGSDEYKESLSKMKPALDHHYEKNSHHPEHYENGVEDMTLIDLIEMLADWKAATERHADGSLRKSLEINEERFKIPSSIIKILKNTAQDLGWVGEELRNKPTEGNETER